MSLFLLFVLIGCANNQTDQTDVNLVTGQIPQESNQMPQETFELPAVVASINGEDVTDQEIYALNTQMEANGLSLSLDELLEQILSRKILLQTANELGIEFTSKDVEAFFIEQGFSEEELRSEVEKQNLDYDEFLLNYIDELKVMELVYSLQSNVEVTEEEMKSFFEAQSALIGENVTYEEVEEEIYFYLLEEKSNEYIMSFIQQKFTESEIEVFY